MEDWSKQITHQPDLSELSWFVTMSLDLEPEWQLHEAHLLEEMMKTAPSDEKLESI